MISLPTLAGALMRFPLGVMSQYIGRKNAALVEMACIMVAMAFGYFHVRSYNDVLAMGVLLGIAGASFGVALALGSGWFPPESKGLAMGIAGAGNSGTAIATFFAPTLAKHYGWQTVYGFAGCMMLLPFLVMLFSPRNRRTGRATIPSWTTSNALFQAGRLDVQRRLHHHLWRLTGLATYLPTFFHDQFNIEPAEAKYYTTCAVLMGSVVRVFGGYLADKLGGIVAVSVVLMGVVGAFLATSVAPSLGHGHSRWCCFMRRLAWATARCSNSCPCAGPPRRRWPGA